MRSISKNAVNWDAQDGFVIDLNPPSDPSPGERVVLERFPDQVTLKLMGEGFTWDTQDLKRDIAAAERELHDYFAGVRQTFDVPLVLKGTEFQERVWRELIRIPYGETISYEQLAIRIGKPTASRAVGMANGRNRLPIIVPCHRVIQKNGQLRGYGGGLWRKQFLLDLEFKAIGATLALVLIRALSERKFTLL